jgi:hypothetical protein
MSAAMMTMKRATTAADFISYSETLTAPAAGRSRSPPTIVRRHSRLASLVATFATFITNNAAAVTSELSD